MKLLCIDCEGPVTLNDNAFEICQHFLPQGGKFFTLISRYDDYLADVIRREGYVAGNTLKLIVPFFKAYGLTNKQVEDFCKESIRFVPNAKNMLRETRLRIKTFIISTSYTPYIHALCKITGFPLENTVSTFLDLDRHPISNEEKKKLIKFYKDIINLSLSPLKERKKDISPLDKKTLSRLDEIFFTEIPSMQCRYLMDKVNPIGGEEKTKAVKKVVSQTRCEIKDTMYVGDSITDADALRVVRKNGGVSISFNGNIYALKEAEFACISSHAYPILVAVDKFQKEGKLGVERMAQFLSQESSYIFAPVTKDNFSYLVEMSEKMRKKVRGEKVGSLG